MSRGGDIQLDFKSKLEQLVLRLNSLTTFPKKNSRQNDTFPGYTENLNWDNVISCQLVNFNFENNFQNKYHVYNYCHQVNIYEKSLIEFFSQKDKNGLYTNKSILSIHKDNINSDDGIWYNDSNCNPNLGFETIKLEFNRPAPTSATYERYDNEEECNVQWNNWCLRMQTIYPGIVGSVFCKKIEIPISHSKKLYSGIFITFTCKLSYTQIGTIGRICEQFLNEIAILDLLPSVYKDLENQATRAAISQVMARNLSHNIGSHVLNNLTDGKTLSDFVSYNCKSYSPNNDFLKNNDLENKIIYQLAIYNHYVKCRMDYLADITYGTPVMHNNKKVYNELYRDLDKVRLLLDNISGLSDQFKFEIKFTFDGSEITTINDFSIALPNDLLGCQAFYNIIENVIRNTAKHNHNKLNKTTFTINFTEVSDECISVKDKELWYQVEIYDDIKVMDDKTFKSDEVQIKENYFDLTKKGASVPVKNIDWLVFSQNLKLNDSVLDTSNNNQLRTSALGLLEMEASAAYLRKLDVTQIESPEYEIDHNENIFNRQENLNVLKAFNKEGALGYRFFVSKPTEFLFVGSFSELTPKRMAELLKMGIWFRTEDDFKKEVENKTVFNHQFLFHKSVKFIKDLEQDLNRKYKTQLPVRIVELDTKTTELLTLLKTEKKFETIEEHVWQIWFDSIKGDNITEVNVSTGYQDTSSRFTTPGTYNIVLQDHDASWDENKKDLNDKKVQYLEPFSANAQNKLPNFNGILSKYVFFNNWKKINGHKLYEAAISMVLVIDERIQRFAETSYLEMPVNEIFKYTNVVIPDARDYPLDANNFDIELSKKICNYIDDQVVNHNFNFLLIHFGILERLFKDNRSMIDIKLKNWAEKTRIIVTSGRGKPPEHLPDEVCFVNLSPVFNVFSQTRSKYSINYLLHQARQ